MKKIILMLFVFWIGVQGKTVFEKEIKMDQGIPTYIDVDKEWNTEGILFFSYDLECHIASSGRQICNNEKSYKYDLLPLKEIIFKDVKKVRKNKKALPNKRLIKYQFIYNNYGFIDTPYESLFSYLFLMNNKFLRKKILKPQNFKEILFINYLDIKNIKDVEKYNNMAYYLQKAGANEEAVYLLEKIIKKFPNRTVAYYNLGDAYWALGEKKKAMKAYTTYIEQMCHKGLQKKIPKVVIERVSNKR